MSFHIGMRVVCVDDNYPFYLKPVRGCVYTIRGFSDGGTGVFGCLLEEIVRPYNQYPNGEERGWWQYRFRPIKTTDISIFTKMLAPTPKEREPV